MLALAPLPRSCRCRRGYWPVRILFARWREPIRRLLMKIFVPFVAFLFFLSNTTLGQTIPSLSVSPSLSSLSYLCSFDRPIARSVKIGGQRCTLVHCLGKLKCPSDENAPCWRETAPDCNKYIEVTITVCMTAQEFEESKKQ